MTVEANDAVETYEISGTGPYAFRFRIFDDEDLTVVALSTDSPPVVVPLTLTTHYSVNGVDDADGGTVTLTAGAASDYDGYTLDIRSNTPNTQPTAFRNQGRFLPGTHEDALDHLQRQLQDVRRQLALCVRFPDNMTPRGEMTPVQSWLSKYLAVSSTGALEAVDLTSSGAISADLVGGVLYPRTAAEISAGVTPSNYAYPEGDLLRYGADPTGVSDSYSAIDKWLRCGSKKLVARGAFSVSAQVSVTIPGDVEVDASGATFTYSGSSTTNNLFVIECDGYSLKWSGGKLDGNDLIAGGFRIENNDAMSDATLPVCHLEDCTIQNFKMNAEGSYNNGALIRGSFEEVVVRNNTVRNITRASGAGTPSVTGTTGIQVGWITSSKYIRHCIHEGNVYSGILGGDAVGSSDNVDYDGFMFFAPDPTNFPNVDSTVYGYPICTVYSRGNSYRNCRGRAMKVQGLANIKGEKVIRDDDYTIYGGSDEINMQWGVGTIEDIEFHYHDYAGPTSPIQTTLTLISAYQGSWYNENHAGLTVRGVRVYNAVKSGVGEPIYAILAANAGATPQTKQRNFIKLEDVAVNRGVVQFMLTSSMDDAAPAVIHMRDITVPELQYSAVGASTNHAATQLIASGVMNMDGVITPADAVPFVSDTSTPGGSRTWGGRMYGSMNGGFENSYRSGVGADAAPALLGAALGDALNTTGGFGSVQSVVVDDDDTYAFGIRGYSPGNGLVLIGCGYDYVAQAVLAVSDSQAHVIAAHASHVFDASVSGSNPDTDGKLNVWVDSGVINIKNRLGSTRSVTMMFLG